MRETRAKEILRRLPEVTMNLIKLIDKSELKSQQGFQLEKDLRKIMEGDIGKHQDEKRTITREMARIHSDKAEISKAI